MYPPGCTGPRIVRSGPEVAIATANIKVSSICKGLEMIIFVHPMLRTAAILFAVLWLLCLAFRGPIADHCTSKKVATAILQSAPGSSKINCSESLKQPKHTTEVRLKNWSTLDEGAGVSSKPSMKSAGLDSDRR